MKTRRCSADKCAWIVMGVSGSGKSRVGMLLAQALQARFIEGDAFHPDENLAKMSSGIPLADADRAGWLRLLHAELVHAKAAGESVVLACSALKRAYRDLLRGAGDDACFVHLHGDPSLIAARMAARSGHFMPLSLLDSQLRDLEPLQPDECGVTLDLRATPEALVAQALAALRPS